MNYNLLELIEKLSKNDKKSLTQKGLKMNEEAGELGRNILAYTLASGSMHKFASTETIIEDCADIMLVALSIMYELGRSYEELESMMNKKAMYWSTLQEHENTYSNDLLPFEIHVTVDYNGTTMQLSDFDRVCANMQSTSKVKPILLNLHGTTISKDLMTSSTYRGTSQGAINVTNKIADELSANGFNVIRKKIETVPFHPNAPKTNNNTLFGVGNYFESHYEIVTGLASDGNKTLAELIEWCKHAGVVLHVSTNERKENGVHKICMVTLRSSQERMEQFKQSTDRVYRLINEAGFSLLGKPLIEYCILDSDVCHDVEWLAKV